MEIEVGQVLGSCQKRNQAHLKALKINPRTGTMSRGLVPPRKSPPHAKKRLLNNRQLHPGLATAAFPDTL
jgi:hypothetical protein